MANIVVIDDDPALRSIMRKVLERSGHSVREADNGDAGMTLVETSVPDVVVTDLLMPDKEGIETILDLQERFPNVPVVAVSGADGGEIEGPLVDARLLGASAILSKPFSIDRFLQVVEGVIGSER